MTKIKVVYIAGSGRSGTTLLNLLLDRHPQMFGVGEIIHLAEYVKHDDPCSCGNPVSNCVVWKNTPKWFGNDTKQLRLIESRKSKIGALVDVLAFIISRRTPSSESKNIAKQNTIRLVNELSNNLPDAEYIVDSSKILKRLLLLAQIPSVELKVIHVVRDGRAVLFSNRRASKARVARTAEAHRVQKQRSVLNLAWRWLTVNVAVSFVGNRYGDYMRVRYEDICENPDDVLGELLQHLLAKPQNLPTLKEKPKESHLIGGNGMRFDGLKNISIDDEYMNSQSASDRILFNLVAGGLNRFYGYR